MAGTSNVSSNEIKGQGEGDEKAVTMLEVLEDEQELEEDANAVLGASDDLHCTYDQGYVKRQALYACMTCTKPDEEKLGGVCLACSYHCHEDHDLVELYTKRNFRCDCGNSIFPNKCTLQPERDSCNEKNSYNENFKGLYCSCKRPYPDPDDDVEDEMIQCIMCEDWYHGRHLGNVPPTDNYSEMICPSCMEKYSFLSYYVGYSVFHVKSSEASENTVAEVTKTDDSSQKDCTSKESDESSKEKDCKLLTFKAIPSKGATYWGEGWRKVLCACQKCKDMYTELKVEFLNDEEDPVQVYEEAAKAKEHGSQYEEGMRALSSLGHVQKIEAIQEYNLMQEELKEYLKKFADNKKVVREEDIREFFSEMKSRKKQRVDANVPHFCH
ncbi:putative E3 ubiquitin-protein ligase UBR7 [Ischnura elegans]|uniref:putative E3 ubiquitin-protein ligase UBR7 n=1 Tax=Ischnura elegans TaxID=197161 RepID=UPI001ED87311|nr:putative E3 ubiquitin-protein ligase UBR7 [Ischnura elegans]